MRCPERSDATLVPLDRDGAGFDPSCDFFSGPFDFD